MSDWNDNIKPIAAKLHAELLKTHGREVMGALVEAIEIARRRAEIEQTRIGPAANVLLASCRQNKLE